jgi:hypothetical protein
MNKKRQNLGLICIVCGERLPYLYEYCCLFMCLSCILKDGELIKDETQSVKQ